MKNTEKKDLINRSRRMICQRAINTTKWYNLSLLALYEYYNPILYADDDGLFAGMGGFLCSFPCSEDVSRAEMRKAFEELIDNNYIMVLNEDEEIYAIRHWRQHNEVRSDLYKASIYTEERAKLFVLSDNTYSLEPKNYMQGRMCGEDKYPVLLPKDCEGIIVNMEAEADAEEVQAVTNNTEKNTEENTETSKPKKKKTVTDKYKEFKEENEEMINEIVNCWQTEINAKNGRETIEGAVIPRLVEGYTDKITGEIRPYTTADICNIIRHRKAEWGGKVSGDWSGDKYLRLATIFGKNNIAKYYEQMKEELERPHPNFKPYTETAVNTIPENKDDDDSDIDMSLLMRAKAAGIR